MTETDYKRFHISHTKAGHIRAVEKRNRLGKYKADESPLVAFEFDNLKELYDSFQEEYGPFKYHKRNAEMIVTYGEGIQIKNKKKEAEIENDDDDFEAIEYEGDDENSIKLVIKEV